MSEAAKVTAAGGVRVVGVFDGAEAEVVSGAGRCHGPAPFGEFQCFNRGPHLAVEVDGHATISVNLPSGQQITFAFLPSGRDGSEHECCDVSVSGATQLKNGDGRMLPAHHVVGFRGGQGQVDSRVGDDGRPATITAILLNRSHYAAGD